MEPRIAAIEARLRPFLAIVSRVVRSPVLRPTARVRMLAVILGSAFGLERRSVAVQVPGGPLFIGRHSPLIDVKIILDVWSAEMFPADCSGRVVLDIGAHKGYFGAWALAHGAVAVVSCEPQRENYELLERCRSANVRRSAWDVERVAVGADEGRATLFVSKGSWAHSLYEHMVDRQGTEEVTVTNLATVLGRAHARRPGHEVVLKLNVEGAAGDVLLAVLPAQLQPIVEVHLDYEPGSPHRIEDILEHLAAAGLTEVHAHQNQLFRVRRPP